MSLKPSWEAWIIGCLFFGLGLYGFSVWSSRTSDQPQKEVLFSLDELSWTSLSYSAGGLSFRVYKNGKEVFISKGTDEYPLSEENLSKLVHSLSPFAVQQKIETQGGVSLYLGGEPRARLEISAQDSRIDLFFGRTNYGTMTQYLRDSETGFFYLLNQSVQTTLDSYLSEF